MIKYIVCGYISPAPRKIETKSLFFQYLHLGGMFKMAKWVYMFTEGDASMRNTLGGKGANLAEMTKLGLPVPQGFTITTDACTQYYEDGRKINDEIMEQIMEAIVKMEEVTGKKFGDKENQVFYTEKSLQNGNIKSVMENWFMNLKVM